jgi:regulator of sigma E protease
MLSALPGGLISFVAIILVFGTIVVVHEWGHMMAAKLCRVAVPDFALGMGPSLFSRRWRGTRYHLCAVPIGGFVQIAGLTGDDPLNLAERKKSRAYLDELEKSGTVNEKQVELDELAKQRSSHVPDEATDGGRYPKVWQDLNGWQKTFILVSGVVMNFVLATVVMLVQGGLVGFPANPEVQINSVAADSPAIAAGVHPGDVVLSVNGKKITELQQFSDEVGRSAGRTVDIEVRRGTQVLHVQPEARSIEGYNGGKPSIGVGLGLQPRDLTTRIALVMPNTPASRLGFKRGEHITAFDGEPLQDGLTLLIKLPGFDEQLRPVDEQGELIPEGGGTPHVLTVQSTNGELRQVTVPGDITGATLGVMFTSRLEKLPPLQSIARSLHDGKVMMVTMLSSGKLLFTKAGADSISGPIGIFSILGQSAQSDAYTFLMWVVLINLNLAIVNLLPLPALDGGRIVFVALSGIGIKVPEKREALVHAAGMLLLLAFMLLISIRDVGGILRGVLAR